MFKRIGGILLIALAAVSGIGYLALQQLKPPLTAALAAALAAAGIHLQHIDIELLPQPGVRLTNVTYRQFQLPTVHARFAAFPLLWGDVRLNGLIADGVTHQAFPANTVRISAQFHALPLRQPTAGVFRFSDANRLQIDLARPLYGNHRRLSLAFGNGELNQTATGQYQLNLPQLKINDKPFGDTHATFAADFSAVNARLNGDCPTRCVAELAYEHRSTGNRFSGQGEKFPLDRLFALLGFPQTLTGTADFHLDLHLPAAPLTATSPAATSPVGTPSPASGQLRFTAENGEILGLNLLDMAAQYLPIHYDRNRLENQKTATPYQQFSAALQLSGDRLDIEKIALKTTALSATGKGNVDLAQTQCQAELNLQATDPQFAALALPVEFYGNCYSPQYKIRFNQDFRRGLKDFLKERFR